MVPADILITDRLALARTGKADARRMRALEPGTQNQPARRGWTRNHLEMRLALIFRELLERDEIDPDDSFFELGGHSVLALHLSGRILKEFGQELPLSALIGNNSVRALAALLADREHSAPAREGASILALKDGGTGTPLILFPGAGGSLLYFEQLAARLPGRRIFGATAGRGSVEQVAEAYAAALIDRVGDRPCHLAGHSFGALVAYEVARQMQRRGRSTGALILLDNPAPTPQPDLRHDRWQDADWYAHIAARIEQLYGVSLDLSPGSTSSIPSADPGTAFADALIAAGIFSRDMPRSQISDLVALYRDNVKAAHRYQRPSDLPHLDLHLVYAVEPQHGPAATETGAEEMVRGWEACTRGEVRSVAAPGNHIGMLLPPNVETLARSIDAVVAEADQHASAKATDWSPGQQPRNDPT
jgi:thioesterase domain-containing protein/acyl carrier protein